MKHIASFILALSAVTASAQTLNNGITLPDVWPPGYPIPPINNGRQLFVDDFLISKTNLKRECHTPNYYTGNPVLEPTEKWENTTEDAPYASPFSDGVWYDEKEGIFKMWYLAGAGSMHKESNQTFYTCYAESKDGKNWVKKKLDIVPGTNIVDTCNRDAATVWLDRYEKDDLLISVGKLS